MTEKINVDEGYFFGLGAFETIAVEDGIPLFLDRHLDRLFQALDFLGIPRRPGADAVYERCRGMEPGSQVLKLAVSGENILMTERKNPYTLQRIERGFDLEYSPVLRNDTSSLVRYKTFNYGDCILEKRRAAAMGIDELIFCNTKGQVCEGTASNIFFVKKGEILTPDAGSGLLPGTVRGVLLENCRIRECGLTPEAVKDAEECFVTNSLMGVMPVNRLGNLIFSQRKTVKMMQEIYRTAAGMKV